MKTQNKHIIELCFGARVRKMSLLIKQNTYGFQIEEKKYEK